VRPLLITNPRSDGPFAQLVAELTADPPPDPADLQTRLRERYPEAVVRRRELSSESTDVWYVYRDGRWTPD
jgi:hypothetical protein